MRLVCFLCRIQHNKAYHYTLPNKVASCLDDLKSVLTNEEQDDEVILFFVHCLLQTLWMSTWVPTPDKLFPDPTLRFIIHTQVEPDGSLSRPEKVTGVFAKMLYLIVCVLNGAHFCLLTVGLEAFHPQ